MEYETAYIRHYKRQDKKHNRTIKSVEVRGLKKDTIFKDKQEVIILSKDTFNNITNELNTLKETNNKIANELTNKDNINNMEFKRLNNKLLELMEIVNNRNQLIINANDKFNLILDNVIKEVEKETLNLINANNKEIKKMLEININECLNNAKATHILEVNKKLNEMSLLTLLRSRKKFNIGVDPDFNMPDIDNIFSDPNFNMLNVTGIKENARNEINFNEFYISFEDD